MAKPAGSGEGVPKVIVFLVAGLDPAIQQEVLDHRIARLRRGPVMR
jgi:hypothetical protein